MDTFYICQPDDKKSCGACCGLYNYEGFDRKMIRAALDYRTDLFKAMAPGESELSEYRNIVSMDPRPKLLEDIYCCEFIGFTDEARRKVGCLIHPMLIGEPDMRDHAFYGKITCAMHKCTAYYYLNEAEARPVIAAIDDWYLYGICITDIDLVKEFYRSVSDVLYQTVRPEAIIEKDAALELFRKYLSLKEDWPYSRGRKRFGQYVFKNDTYKVTKVDWKALGMERPREYRILRSLGNDFRDAEEARDALKIVRDIVGEMADILGG